MLPKFLTSLVEAGFVAIILGGALSIAQSQPKATTSKTYSVCEVLADPTRFDGEMIRIRSRVYATDEGSWLDEDLECPGIFVTDGYVWPSEIDWETDVSEALHPIDFKFDRESWSQLLVRYRELALTLPDSCIEWTYTGLFETRLDWSKAKKVYPNGKWILIGFGHLNAAPGRLIVKSADEVRAAPTCPNPK